MRVIVIDLLRNLSSGIAFLELLYLLYDSICTRALFDLDGKFKSFFGQLDGEVSSCLPSGQST